MRGKRLTFAREARCNRPSIDSQMLSDCVDRAPLRAKQRHDDFAHTASSYWKRGRRSSCRRASARSAPCPDRAFGLGASRSLPRADDSVENVAEFDVAAEPRVRARNNRQARHEQSRHAAASKSGPRKRTQHAKYDADRQFGRLANRTGVPDDQLFAQHDDVATFFDREETAPR
jgi:hypothetical protein